jgi:O-antigen/teichoic acid export membrane protein
MSKVNFKYGQAGSLYIAVLLSIVIGIGSSIITTRILGPQDYGDLKFIQNFFQLLATIAPFGILPTGALLLARMRENDLRKSELIGAILLITAFLSLVFMTISVGFSFFENRLLGNLLGQTILLFSPLVAILIFQPCLEYILQGDNQIYKLSFSRIMPGLLYVILMLLMQYFFHITLGMSLLIQLVTSGIITIVIIQQLHPTLTHFKENKNTIIEANKHYGWHIYLGSLSSVATSYLSTFMISYYIDNTQVGFFALATTISMPLAQIANVVGTTYFKDFTKEKFLPRKITLVAVGFTLVAFGLFVIFIKYLVVILYTQKFIEVVSLSYIIALGYSFLGIGDFLNRFLQAHGKGKELRNGAFLVGFVNIFGYFLLIKFFGVTGAAITQCLSGFIYLCVMFYYYRNFKR